MKNKVLQKLEDVNMHVHIIDHQKGYSGMNLPLAHLVMSTHFIMQGENIVHLGNLKTIESFALQL